MRRFVFAVIAGPLPCFAQSLPAAPDTEAVVVTATRSPVRADDVAAGVSVIDQARIEAFGYTDLVQLLDDVPGLRVAQAGGPGSQASVFVRGTNSNQVLVLRDGVPVNDPGTPGGAFNFGDDGLADVARVEIIRGPMASVYGSGAIGGVINLISAAPREGLHGDLSLGAGSQGSLLEQLHLTGRSGPFDIAASGEVSGSSGFDQTPKRLATYTGERDGDRLRQGSLEIGVSPQTDTRVALFVRGHTDLAGYDQSIDAANAHGRDASAEARLSGSTILLDGAWQSSAFVSRLEDWRHYLVTLDPLDPTASAEDDHYAGTRTELQWNNTLRLPDWGELRRACVQFGTEHGVDTANTAIDSVSYGAPYVSGVRASDHVQAEYFGAQAELLGRLVVSAQGRADATSDAGDATTWRAGAVLGLGEVFSRLKFSYGTGFRAPALYDRFGVDSYGYMGNPRLRPEHSAGWEAGFVTDLAAHGAARVEVTYFDNRLRDLIELEYAPVYTPVNVAQARAHGVEAQFDWEIAPWASGEVSYTYTDARNGQGGTRLLRRPYDQAGGRLVLRPVEGVRIAPEVVYTGSFVDYLTNDQGVGLGDGLSPAGTIVNLNLSWQVRPYLQFFAWGKNLNASRFEPVNGYQVAGRSVLLGGKVTF